MMALPVTYVDARHVVDEPFNNLTNSEILMQAVPECSTESILVFDSHYMDLGGMVFL